MRWAFHWGSEAGAEAWEPSQVCLYFCPLCAGGQASLFGLVPDSRLLSSSACCALGSCGVRVSPLPTAAALLEMIGAAQTVVGLRDGESSKERVVCPAKGEPL